MNSKKIGPIAFERLEQRLEVAFAEALVALALDEFEEDGSQHSAGENLQQQSLLSVLGGAVEQDAARSQ